MRNWYIQVNAHAETGIEMKINFILIQLHYIALINGKQTIENEQRCE